MSLINTIRTSKLCINKHAIFFTAIRHHWNKDYEPGPYPKTPKEREAAAKKYGLDISEYEPYPDNGVGLGDYPKMPDISAESRDPYYPWDNPELKRNFNEPVHADEDLIGEDRYDVSVKLKFPLWVYWAQFFGALLASYGLYHAFELCKMFPAVLPKQYPQPGVKHYTFEEDN